MEVPMQNTPTRNPENMKSRGYKARFFPSISVRNMLRKVASRHD
jgi:hypothetical protein